MCRDFRAREQLDQRDGIARMDLAQAHLALREYGQTVHTRGLAHSKGQRLRKGSLLGGAEPDSQTQ